MGFSYLLVRFKPDGQTWWPDPGYLHYARTTRIHTVDPSLGHRGGGEDWPPKIVQESLLGCNLLWGVVESLRAQGAPRKMIAPVIGEGPIFDGSSERLLWPEPPEAKYNYEEPDPQKAFQEWAEAVDAHEAWSMLKPAEHNLWRVANAHHDPVPESCFPNKWSLGQVPHFWLTGTELATMLREAEGLYDEETRAALQFIIQKKPEGWALYQATLSALAEDESNARYLVAT